MRRVATRRYVFAHREASRFHRISNAGDNSPASWSPDGKQILFVRTQGGDNELYVMNADGTGVTQLTTTKARATTRAGRPTVGGSCSRAPAMVATSISSS